jgi:5-methylcytosine-specific restriction enzyme A
MPRKRPPKIVWLTEIRPLIWERDGRQCVRCNRILSLKECHIDHIQSGKLGSNKISNLRTLCRVCHVLRADHRHRGMTAKALKDGIIPPNWRSLVWKETQD